MFSLKIKRELAVTECELVFDIQLGAVVAAHIGREFRRIDLLLVRTVRTSPTPT